MFERIGILNKKNGENQSMPRKKAGQDLLMGDQEDLENRLADREEGLGITPIKIGCYPKV